MTKRSGVVIYFQWLPVVQKLSNERSGRLFQGLLSYASNGKEPDFSDDEVLLVLWPLLRESIDADGRRYTEKVKKKEYGGYCRSEREKGREPLPFDSWSKLEVADGSRCLQVLADVANNNSESNYQTESNDNSESNYQTESNDNFFLNTNTITCSADAPPPTKKGFVAPSVDEVQSFAVMEGLIDDAKNFVNYYQSIDWKSGKSQIVDWRARYRSWISSGKQRGGEKYQSGGDRLAEMIKRGDFDD